MRRTRRRQFIGRDPSELKSLFSDLVMDSILYLGYYGESPSLTIMARDLKTTNHTLRVSTLAYLSKIGCVSIGTHKWGTRVRLTEKGFKVFVLMEAIGIILHVPYETLETYDNPFKGAK